MFIILYISTHHLLLGGSNMDRYFLCFAHLTTDRTLMGGKEIQLSVETLIILRARRISVYYLMTVSTRSR